MQFSYKLKIHRIQKLLGTCPIKQHLKVFNGCSIYTPKVHIPSNKSLARPIIAIQSLLSTSILGYLLLYKDTMATANLIKENI